MKSLRILSLCLFSAALSVSSAIVLFDSTIIQAPIIMAIARITDGITNAYDFFWPDSMRRIKAVSGRADKFPFCRFLTLFDFEGSRKAPKYDYAVVAQRYGDCEQLLENNFEFLVMNEHHICIRQSAFGWSYRGVPPVSTEDSRCRHTNWYLLS